MTRTRRKLIFLSLLAAFAVAVPLLLAYSLGYTFDLENGGFAQTGGVFLKSRTAEISVYLDGNLVRSTSFIVRGALLTDISPAAHIVRIEKQGFKPWLKAISVEPAIVSGFREILLIPREPVVATATPAELAAITERVQNFEKPAFPRPAGATTTPTELPRYSLSAAAELIEHNAATSTLLAQNVNSYAAFDDGSIVFIDKNGFLARRAGSDEPFRTLARPGFFLNEEQARFIRSPRNEIAILDTSGGLYFLDREGSVRLLGGNVQNATFDSEGRKLLMVRPQNLEIAWLEANPRQPFQPVGTQEELISFAGESHAITGARWLYSTDAHVVFSTAQGVFMTEIDGRGGRNTGEIFADKTDALFTAPDYRDSVFFRRGEQWFKITL